MKTFLLLTVLCLFYTNSARCQKLYFPAIDYADSSALAMNIPSLAKMLIVQYREKDSATYYEELFRLRLIAGEYALALKTLDTAVRLMSPNPFAGKVIYFNFRVFCLAADSAGEPGAGAFQERFPRIFESLFRGLPTALNAYIGLGYEFDSTSFKAAVDDNISAQRKLSSDSITIEDAVTLCYNWCGLMVFERTGSAEQSLVSKFDDEKYISDDSVLITMPDGGTVSLTVVRKRAVSGPQPVVMKYTIYPGEDHFFAKEIARKGYVGVIANTRGKRLSNSPIAPFEQDAKDVYSIIDWISKQPWCNGKVGMYGGSYLGFAQWSAVKYLHPALKTIVPQVSVGAGIDFPMQNGVFMSYMLRWIHYVSNGKGTDITDFDNDKKWDSLFEKWYAGGGSFRSLDTLDAMPNAIFQRWLQHPSYDDYWKNMTPQNAEFSKLNIPMLTISGYWDDDQLGAMYYYKQHLKWDKEANHYLLIGPYDHQGAQGSPKHRLGGYALDSVANRSITDIVFQWFNYVLRDGTLPSILADKVNYEVMGANEWKHVPSLDKMSNDTLALYLSDKKEGDWLTLTKTKPQPQEYIEQTVDFKNRTYMAPRGGDISAFKLLIDTGLHPVEQMVFVGEPLTEATTISGTILASMLVSINKKDFDIVTDYYVQMPDGKYFALNENVQRASYAQDPSVRHLMQPGKMERISMTHNFMTAVYLPKGSRIVAMVGVNKNMEWEINYGTGKDVSQESIKDAALPLHVKWYSGSCIKFPIQK